MFPSAFTFGFENPLLFQNDVPGVHTFNLSLAVKGNSTTEIPITVMFSLGNGTTAQVGEGTFTL